MKKLILSAVTVLSMTLASFAQISGPGVQPGGTYTHHNQTLSFINQGVKSLVVSNTAGTILLCGITNLNSLISNGSVGAGTNAIPTMWTNWDGTAVITSAANSDPTNANNMSAIPLLIDVPLNGDRNQTFQLGPNVTASATNSPIIGTLQARIVGRSGKSGTILFRFKPIYGDVATNEPTAVGEVILWGVAVNGVTPVIACTNLLANRVLGAGALRLVDISSGDTGAGTDAFITEIKFCAFVP